jgi:hypothetical protein
MNCNIENHAVWTDLFNEQVSEKGIQFLNEESKNEALDDFILQCEGGGYQTL